MTSMFVRWIGGGFAFAVLVSAGCSDPHYLADQQRRSANISRVLADIKSHDAARPAKLNRTLAKIKTDMAKRKARWRLVHPVWCVVQRGVRSDYWEGKFDQGALLETQPPDSVDADKPVDADMAGAVDSDTAGSNDADTTEPGDFDAAD